MRTHCFSRPSVRLLAAWSALALAGCSVTSTERVSYEPETFDSTTTHTRNYPASEAQTCEAARRALLSQGYMITTASADLVTGRKSFQPAAEVHVEVELRTVCARDASPGSQQPDTIVFVTALQDRYSLKKVNNSASLGVGASGTLSLPFSSSDDAMVKVASETLADARFYDRFFALMDRFLTTPGEEPIPEPTVAPPPVPPRLPAALPSPVALPSATPEPVPGPAPAPVTAPASTAPVAASPDRG